MIVRLLFGNTGEISKQAMFFAGTTLFGAEGLDGVDGGGAARGQIAREERSGDEAERSSAIGDWIDGAHLE